MCFKWCAVIGIFVQIPVSLLEGMVLVPLGAIIFKTVTCSREQPAYCENFSERENVIHVCGKRAFQSWEFYVSFCFRRFLIQTTLFIVWSGTGFLKFSDWFCHWKWTFNFEIMSILYSFLHIDCVNTLSCPVWYLEKVIA